MIAGSVGIVTDNMYNLSGRRKTKVELSSRDLEDAARILSTITSARSTEEPRVHDAGDNRAIQRAAAMVESRERRKKFFNASMFGEPAWDVLLALYLAEASGVRTNVNTLTLSAGVAPTTALRWIDYLENQQLVRREKHPTDARASIVRITDKAQRALELYLLETLP